MQYSYNESSNNMYENLFKKRLITVPVSHVYHTIIISTSTILTRLSWVVLTLEDSKLSFNE